MNFAKATGLTAFKSWGTFFEGRKCSKMILEGWWNIQKHVLCERWRETHFQFIHRAIYGFNVPSTLPNPSGITAWPKCNTPLTDLWHGVWTCSASQEFWDQVISYIKTHWKLDVPSVPEFPIFHYTRPPEEDAKDDTREIAMDGGDIPGIPDYCTQNYWQPNGVFSNIGWSRRYLVYLYQSPK